MLIVVHVVTRTVDTDLREIKSAGKARVPPHASHLDQPFVARIWVFDGN